MKNSSIFGRTVLLAVCATTLCLAGCSKDNQPPVDEAVDDAATQRLQESLMGSMDRISQVQSKETDQSNVADLERVAESDRQALIDKTLAQSEQEAEQTLQNIANSLEENKEVEHAPIETLVD